MQELKQNEPRICKTLSLYGLQADKGSSRNSRDNFSGVGSVAQGYYSKIFYSVELACRIWLTR